MKRLITAIALTTILAPAAFAKFRQEPPQPLLARVTVYWASGGRGSDRYTRQHKCATGMRLQTGHCAVDPRHIPYGSKVIFPDGTSLAAVDTGTAVKNRKAARLSGRTNYERNAIVIDRFFETKRQALAWANTHPHFMPVKVVPPNYRMPAPLQSDPQAIGAVVAKSSSSSKPAAMTTRPVFASNTTGAKNSLMRLGR